MTRPICQTGKLAFAFVVSNANIAMEGSLYPSIRFCREG